MYDDPKLEEQLLTDLCSAGLPNWPDCQVLLTSRSPNWTHVSVMPVSGFTEDEGMQFAQRMLPDVPHADLHLLCVTLGFHPLALCQAIGYLQKTKRGIAAYVNAYKSSHRLRGSEAATTLDGYGLTIEATVALATEQFLQDKRAAGGLALRIVDHIAFLAATPLPTSVLRRFVTSRHWPGNVDEAISLCEDYGLLQRVDGTVLMHQMHELTAEVRRGSVLVEQHAEIRADWIHMFYNMFSTLRKITRESLHNLSLVYQHAETVCKEWRESQPAVVVDAPPALRNDWTLLSYCHYHLAHYWSVDVMTAFNACLLVFTIQEIIFLQFCD